MWRNGVPYIQSAPMVCGLSCSKVFPFLDWALVLLKHLFYIFDRQKDEERMRASEWERSRSFLAIGLLQRWTQQGQKQVRLEPVASNCIWVSHMGGGTQERGPSSAAFPGPFAGSWTESREACICTYFADRGLTHSATKPAPDSF